MDDPGTEIFASVPTVRGLFSPESVTSPLLMPGNGENGDRQRIKGASGWMIRGNLFIREEWD